MAKVIFHEPNITREENERRFQEVKELIRRGVREGLIKMPKKEEEEKTEKEKNTNKDD